MDSSDVNSEHSARWKFLRPLGYALAYDKMGPERGSAITGVTRAPRCCPSPRHWREESPRERLRIDASAPFSEASDGDSVAFSPRRAHLLHEPPGAAAGRLSPRQTTGGAHASRAAALPVAADAPRDARQRPFVTDAQLLSLLGQDGAVTLRDHPFVRVGLVLLPKDDGVLPGGGGAKPARPDDCPVSTEAALLLQKIATRCEELMQMVAKKSSQLEAKVAALERLGQREPEATATVPGERPLAGAPASAQDALMLQFLTEAKEILDAMASTDSGGTSTALPQDGRVTRLVDTIATLLNGQGRRPPAPPHRGGAAERIEPRAQDYPALQQLPAACQARTTPDLSLPAARTEARRRASPAPLVAPPTPLRRVGCPRCSYPPRRRVPPMDVMPCLRYRYPYAGEESIPFSSRSSGVCRGFPAPDYAEEHLQRPFREHAPSHLLAPRRVERPVAASQPPYPSEPKRLYKIADSIRAWEKTSRDKIDRLEKDKRALVALDLRLQGVESRQMGGRGRPPSTTSSVITTRSDRFYTLDPRARPSTFPKRFSLIPGGQINIKVAAFTHAKESEKSDHLYVCQLYMETRNKKTKELRLATVKSSRIAFASAAAREEMFGARLRQAVWIRYHPEIEIWFTVSKAEDGDVTTVLGSTDRIYLQDPQLVRPCFWPLLSSEGRDQPPFGHLLFWIDQDEIVPEEFREAEAYAVGAAAASKSNRSKAGSSETSSVPETQYTFSYTILDPGSSRSGSYSPASYSSPTGTTPSTTPMPCKTFTHRY